jgi:hypothetical protein
MAEPSQLDLQIILEIVKYLRHRTEGPGVAPGEAESRVINIVANLERGTELGSLFHLVERETQEVIVGDQYTTGQAGAVGPNSVAIGQQFHQVWVQRGDSIDLACLATELRQLRTEARGMVTGSPNEDIAMAELAHAEVAANAGDGPRTLNHLARAGRWALDKAQMIGVQVAVKAIESSMGL